jgi:hypothetical protein
MKMIAAVPRTFSAAERKRATDFALRNPASVPYLVETFLTEHYRTGQRVASVLETLAKRRPQLIEPHLRRFLIQLDKPTTGTALKRNIPRILQWMTIPANLQARTVNSCLRLLGDPAELVAAKVFSMTVLANIATEQPDLANEIRAHIEAQYNLSTPAFRSRGKKVLKKLDRISLRT